MIPSSAQPDNFPIVVGAILVFAAVVGLLTIGGKPTQDDIGPNAVQIVAGP